MQAKRLHNPSLWLGVAGLALMVLLMGRRVKGAIMAGILFVTFISWIPYHGATYFGEASQIKGAGAADTAVRCAVAELTSAGVGLMLLVDR